MKRPREFLDYVKTPSSGGTLMCVSGKNEELFVVSAVGAAVYAVSGVGEADTQELIEAELVTRLVLWNQLKAQLAKHLLTYPPPGIPARLSSDL